MTELDMKGEYFSQLIYLIIRNFFIFVIFKLDSEMF